VDNSNFVPSPEPTVSSENEPEATLPSNPTPTLDVIVQPPTATPTPIPEGAEEDEITPTAETEGPSLDLAKMQSSLQNAFCTGGLITVMLFLLWGLYVMGKASIRWYLRGSGPVRK
jgi:hypothetical protein